jgi:soluble lytic murein transglycosylase-like protein
MGYAAELQHAHSTGIFDLIKASAAKHGLELTYLLGISSRESDIENVIGDGGHAVGPLQVDIRFHPIAAEAKASGSWKTDPGPIIDYGAAMLADNIDWAKRTYPQFGSGNGRGWLKIAASAYNAGQGGAARGVTVGDSDKFTTGQNYGADVLGRMDAFSHLI